MLNGAIYLQGMLVGASLIVPIGAQNAFVLERGIRRNHALLVAALCFLADAFLIALGVGGAGKVITQSLTLQLLLTLGGAVFLLRYGWSSLVRAWQATAQTLAQQGGMPRVRAVTMTLAVTLLNPHVYLDTVMIQGAVSGQYPRVQQLSFALGSISASFLWFFGLALLASWLAPQLQRVRVQQFIDGGVGVVMWLIAFGLLRHAAFIV
ncbi:LysE/ArgO family amino acid transporter [uncultured Tolumonas sp.]|uniref:LysE/ArgO family amino acid transporter n=1 Tax=uncultured Tolumonas sp. TaxID=263765 RepID=UPI002A0A149A|nr:LysE/ArgO family amino acid transporter [uncultured Tolumonas sp.]